LLLVREISKGELGDLVLRRFLHGKTSMGSKTGRCAAASPAAGRVGGSTRGASGAVAGRSRAAVVVGRRPAWSPSRCNEVVSAAAMEFGGLRREQARGPKRPES
jgi:hypothetical protein